VGPPFQAHYFSENLVAPGIEPEPLDMQPGTLTTRPQKLSHVDDKNRILKTQVWKCIISELSKAF
jgi:hypothetical protein